MKKILAIALLLGLVLVLTGCECGHKRTIVPDKKQVRCERDGFTGNVICTDCGEIVVPGEVVPAAGHTPGELQGYVDSTCTEEGYTGDLLCTVCNVLLEQGVAIEVKPHTPAETRQGAKEASCAEEGYTGDLLCTACGAQVEAGTVIEALPHTPGEPTNAVAATCAAAGQSGDVFCTVCEALIEASAEIAPLPHTPGEPANAVAATCAAAGQSGDVFCTVCETLIEASAETAPLPHAIEGEACSVCGQTPAGLYTDGTLAKDWAALVNDGEITISEGVITAANPAISGKLALDAQVKEIGYGAFDGCRNLTAILLNEGLEKISGRAFRYTGIESVAMPSTLASIGRDSFVGCANLAVVDMSAVQGEWTSLSLHTFGDCPSLSKLILPEGLKAISGGWMELPGLKELSLPEGLSSCAVQSEYIEILGWPVSMTNGFSVVEGMPNLMTIHYRGSEDQWQQVAGSESLFAAVIFNYAE